MAFGTGSYKVTFGSNMSGCAYVATAADPAAGPLAAPVSVTVASLAGNANAVYVETRDQTTGELSSQPFHLVTHCPKRDTFAVVDATGRLARGVKVRSTARSGPGEYVVTFARDVDRCALNATIGTTGIGAVANPGVLTVAPRAGDERGAVVRIVDRLGGPVDQPFHLAVTCESKSLFAVVDGTGRLARGSHVRSTDKPSPTLDDGRYEVVFDRPVSGCAYSATVGATMSGRPVLATALASAAGSAFDPRGVSLVLRQTDGSTVDGPYHLAVYC
jgi:hypothetical protein